jgi:N-acylneuraminate cytidylyltransferase
MITAVIPARAGSRRLQHKNVHPFQGEPMLTRKVRQLRQVQGLGRVVVSSDSDEYLAMAREAGAETHKRRPELCDEISVPFGEVVASVAEDMETGTIMWAPCTTPLALPEHYEQAIALYLERMPADGLVTVEESKTYYWHDGQPVNYDPERHVPSQQLKPVQRLSGAIYMWEQADMVRHRYFHGCAPLFLPLPRIACVDIDDELDMAIALAWAEMQ